MCFAAKLNYCHTCYAIKKCNRSRSSNFYCDIRSKRSSPELLVYSNVFARPSYPYHASCSIYLHRATTRSASYYSKRKCITLCSRYTCGWRVHKNSSTAYLLRSSFRKRSAPSYHVQVWSAFRRASRIRTKH